MNNANATATTTYASGYTCPECKQWVNNFSTAQHICPGYQQPTTAAWPTTTIDPRLLAVLERIAAALEAKP